MAEQNNKQPLAMLGKVVAVLVAAAALAACYFGLRAKPVHTPPPAPPAAPAPAAVYTATPPATARTQPAAVSSNDLARMKEEFAALMRQRAGLQERARACSKLIAAARRSTPGSTHANDVTAVRFREASRAVEQALDAHPRILALQALYDVAETDKVAVSKQQSAILDAWNAGKQGEHHQMNAALQAADHKAQAARQVIFDQAGVKRYPQLSEEDRQRMDAIQIQFTNELAQIHQRHAMLISTTFIAQVRQADGSTERFAACTTRYKELETQQNEIRQQQLVLRGSLRQEDPAIAALQAAAVEASRAHQQAIAALPEVAEARAFLDGVNAQRSVIDRQARVLRKAILAVEPAYKDVMDKQAMAGGLALAGEDFWNVQG